MCATEPGCAFVGSTPYTDAASNTTLVTLSAPVAINGSVMAVLGVDVLVADFEGG